MRRIIGTIGAALAIAVLVATGAGTGSASHEQASAPGGSKSFVGPADDAFFVDLGSVFDGINIDKPGRPMTGTSSQGGGQDDVSGFSAAFVETGPKDDLKNFGGSALSPEPA